jgi:hypothetical protein
MLAASIDRAILGPDGGGSSHRWNIGKLLSNYASHIPEENDLQTVWRFKEVCYVSETRVVRH